MHINYRFVRLVLLSQTALLLIALGALYVQTERLSTLSATLDGWVEGKSLSSSRAVPGFAFSDPSALDMSAVSPGLVRQVVREEVALITSALSRVESALQDSARMRRQPDAQLASAAPTLAPEDLQPIRDAVARGLRELSRNSDPFGPQHSRLISNIMQLPVDERGEAMRLLNQRMNQ